MTSPLKNGDPNTQETGSTTTLAKNCFRIISLTAISGFVEVTAFMDCDRLYASIMTGNTVQLGISLACAKWMKSGLFAYAILLFFANCIIASLIRSYLARPFIELTITSGLLVLVSVVRLYPEYHLALELPLLSLALAMQGESINRFGPVSLQTLVVTNNIIKFCDAFTRRFLLRRCHNENGNSPPTPDETILPGLAWLTYMVSAGIAAIANDSNRFFLLLPACLAILVAADLKREETRQNHQPSKP